jgi:ABC-type branched-subunit amino acid transport system permease subunit
MPDVKPFLVTGLALGSVYALGGVGIVVPYRATGVVNFAYGAVGATGALLSYSLIHSEGVPEWGAYLVGAAFAGLATLLYGVLVAPVLARRDALTKATGTLGLMLILLGAMYWVYSDDARSLIFPSTHYGFYVGEVRVTATQLIALGLGILITAVTAAFLRYTRLGTAMRSLANDREATAMLGVPVRRVEAAAWLGSGLVCGAGSLLLATLVRLDANALTFLVISSLAAALVGRLRFLWVTLFAGIVIGLVEAILTPFNSMSQYRSLTPFVFAIVALLWFNRVRVVNFATQTATMVARAEPRILSERAERTQAVIRVAVIGLVVAFCLIALPELTSTYWIKVFTAISIYSISALGLGLLYGRVGMVSLCQISLLAVGGWVTLRLGYGTGVPFPLLLVIAGGITAVIGVAVGLSALRLSGLYLALITLMFAAAVSIVLQVISFPNGGGGFKGIRTDFQGAQMRRPEIATGEGAFMRYSMIVAGILFLLALLHLRTRPGRAWAAIRHGEAAAVSAGINVTLYKLWAFALASFITGIAGGLLAASIGILDWRQFPTVDSIVLLAAVLIGGIHSLWGAVIAGLFMRGVPAVLDTLGLPANLILVLFGVGLLQVLLTAPTGIAGQLQDAGSALARRFERRRHRAELAGPAPGGGT